MAVQGQMFDVDVVVGEVEVGPVLAMPRGGGLDGIESLAVKADAAEGRKIGDLQFLEALDQVAAEGPKLERD
ncbi:MAG: hypothetical protein OXG65_16835 [Chloroflexi bacterium]|nr:hypothetical protein [Chloroflexota bacterium]